MSVWFTYSLVCYYGLVVYLFVCIWFKVGIYIAICGICLYLLVLLFVGLDWSLLFWCVCFDFGCFGFVVIYVLQFGLGLMC